MKKEGVNEFMVRDPAEGNRKALGDKPRKPSKRGDDMTRGSDAPGAVRWSAESFNAEPTKIDITEEGDPEQKLN